MSRARRRRAIRVSREYAVSPERLWRAISERDQIARWLMPNDFEPRVGHRFTMKSDPAPGFDGRVECEVLALEPPTRMIWGWRGGPIDTTDRARSAMRWSRWRDATARACARERGWSASTCATVECAA